MGSTAHKHGHHHSAPPQCQWRDRAGRPHGAWGWRGPRRGAQGQLRHVALDIEHTIWALAVDYAGVLVTCVEVAQPPRTLNEIRKCDTQETTDVMEWVSTEPKRPPSAFFLYTNEAKQRYPQPLVRQHIMEIQQGWSVMDPDLKSSYNTRASFLKEAYDRHHSQYREYGCYHTSH